MFSIGDKVVWYVAPGSRVSGTLTIPVDLFGNWEVENEFALYIANEKNMVKLA